MIRYSLILAAMLLAVSTFANKVCSIKATLAPKYPNNALLEHCPGTIASIDCASAVNNGSLFAGASSSTVSSSISYTGGDGGSYKARSVNSTGITGLTATIEAGSFANGNGTLTYTIEGTPSGTGIANFAISIGGQSCTLIRNVVAAVSYPPGTFHCGVTPTSVLDVTSSTGKVWMDRNLGAAQAATSSTDESAYGDLYQWGRRADGHQCRTPSPATTSTQSSIDQPLHGNFIIGSADWRSSQNDNLWQGVSGVNNPCPQGYRLPTSTELQTEMNSWKDASNNPRLNAAGAFASPLKLPLAGNRSYGDGSLYSVGSYGNYWSSTVNGTNAYYLFIYSGGATIDNGNGNRAYGCSVRCIKD